MERHLRIARYLANFLDSKYKFGKFRFGLDPIIGFIPGLGDAVPVIIGSYIIYIGIRLELPKEKISEMIGNVVADFFLGTIPIIGDIADFVFKAHTKNLKIIEEHLKKKPIDAETVD
jgi:hypothetical protein